MPWTSKHIKWLVNTEERLTTVDGKKVEVLEFRYENNDEIMSAWAKHFRNHYCLDSDIDFMRGKSSRKDYLNSLKFPSATPGFGPGIRAGDFGEILVADYLQWILGYWIPRIRWASKAIPDESSKGSDVIGFQFCDPDQVSGKDILAIFEVKAGLSKSSGKDRLQDAVNDSAKDYLRLAFSLHYIKQKLYDRKEKDNALKVERFQNPVDIAYQKVYGAAALFTDTRFDSDVIAKTDTTKIPVSKKNTAIRPHPNRDQLFLVVIRGKSMMNLVHDLYRRAADEA